ncbi:MAG: NfeD family protein [Gammaproteobacteria bacterium]|nr:NfeD family protein [Gammaproteobacteria bacterium]
MDQAIYWHWLALAVGLLILEAVLPSAFFLWLGLAAGLVGGLLWIFPEIGWQYQLLLFALFSVVSIVVGRHFFKVQLQATDQPRLNRRGEQYLDRVFTLDEPIVNGQGKIRVDDSSWKIHGSDCPGGSRVKVTGVDGVVLVVEQV